MLELNEDEIVILNLARKILPQPIRRRVKYVLAQPPFYYAKMAAKVYRQWLFKTYPPRYQLDKAPMMGNYSDYETLFEASESNFEAVVTPYVSEFTWFVGRIYNDAFVSIDPELYYSMIRQYKPNLIIEIGSGHSTHFAVDAVKKNQKGHIISIDPEPRRSLPNSVKHIQAKVEDVSADIFAALGENDILFIDSSHTAEEALYHCRQILPNLGKGVIVHHHDFTYPYGIYYQDDPVAFGEPDVLLEFYSANTDLFEIIVSASYVRFRNPQLVNRLIRSYRWNPLRVPGSLWTGKKS